MLFGHPSNLKNESLFKEIRQSYPNAYILSGSTAGEILKTRVYDDSLVATAIWFENTVLKPTHLKIKDRKDSLSIGEELVNTLDHEELCHVFVLADGLNVNGTELIKGMVKHLPEGVKVTGGLTGDGGEFKETLTGANQMPESKNVVALGFYGTRLKVHCGSMSGFEPFGPERKITLGDLPILDADPSQMRQLLQNLIENALKYHKPDIPPVIHLDCQPSQNGCWEISVQDNGIGLDEKFSERIFVPLERLHGRSAYEGTGIGLAICKKIVSRHGGRITVKSQLGEGSTFTITLPKSQPT